MIVLEFDPSSGDVIPSPLVTIYINDIVNIYRTIMSRLLPIHPTHAALRVHIGSIELLRGFLDAIEDGTINVREVCIRMYGRQVYFLFLKNLFSGSEPVTVESLEVIFRNPKSSFAVH